MYLESSLDMQGYWWLPTSPEIKIPGRLVCTREAAIELEVIGTFTGKLLEDFEELPVILGDTEKGKAVTLVRCLYKTHNLNFPGLVKSLICAHLLFVGAHVEDPESIRFNRMTSTISGLDEWVGVTGINVEHDLKDKAALIRYKLPPPIEAELREGERVSVVFSCKIPSGLGNISSAGIEQQAHLRVEFLQERPFEELSERLSRLNNFLCLAMDQAVGLTGASVSSQSLTRTVGEKEIQEEIEVYYPSIPSVPAAIRVRQSDMLFRYSDIADRFAHVLELWLEKYETLRPAFNLYFAIAHNGGLYMENQFLGLVQGLETLHRRTTPNKKHPEQVHEERLTRILQSVPEEYREWLEAKLAYSNEPSLRSRLRDLLRPFGGLTSRMEDIKSFINKVVDTRNYLTHYDKSLEGRAARGQELYELIQKLQALFHLHLLSLLEFEESSIRKIVGANQQLSLVLGIDK